MLPDGPAGVVAGAALVISVYAALFGGAELLRRWGVSGEQTRSIVHVLSAILALGLPTLFGSPWPVIGLAIMFAAFMVASERHGLLGSIHDVDRQTIGAAVFPLGLAAAYVLTGGQVPGYPIAVLALGLGDPAAALAGRRSAHAAASVWGTRRSVVGSVAGCLVSSITTMVVLLVAGGRDAPSLLMTTLAVGVTVALAEATSPRGLDNIAIPAAAAIVVNLLDTPWRLVTILAALIVVTVAGLVRGRSVANAAQGVGRLR